MKSIKGASYLLLIVLLALFITNCNRNDNSVPPPTLATVTATTASPSVEVNNQVATPAVQQTQVVTQPQTQIRIGIAIDQTGRDNAPGRDQQIGTDLAEKYFRTYLCDNPEATHNFCVDFVYRDTRSDIETATAVFSTLIYTDNVAVIIGPTYSEQAIHVYPLAEDAGVPVIGPSTTADGIPQIGKYISRVSAPVAVYAPLAVTAVATDTQRVAVIYQADDYFTLSETHAFTQAVQVHNLTLTLVESYPLGTTDFSLQVSKILSATPDLVIVSGRFKDGIRFVKQLRQTNYTGKLIGGNGFNATAIFEACGQACDGLYVAQAYNAQRQDLPINQAFVHAYQAAGYEGAPSQISAQMFTAVQVVIETLGLIESPSEMTLVEIRDVINQKLLSGLKFETPLGTIKFTAEGEICQTQFFVTQIIIADSKSGEFKSVPLIDASKMIALEDKGC